MARVPDPGLLLAIGSAGYRRCEGAKWSYFDGFDMAAITPTAIEYCEIVYSINTDTVLEPDAVMIALGR